MDKREKIDKVLAQRAACRKGSLSFSYLKIELTIRAGETAEGNFQVMGEDGLPLSGVVVTGDTRMHCLTPEFSGSPAEIFYRFDSTGLDERDMVRGVFQVISSQGEYVLPYVVFVSPNVFETSLGQMKNLFHFANLARTNWQEAVKIFYDKDFCNLLTGSERQYLNGYRILSMRPHTEQKVEEFLMWIRKKQRVSYETDRDAVRVSLTEDVAREVVVLTRTGWGYTKLQIETEGKFLKAEKSVLTDDDFLGNQCPCGFVLFRDGLHGGRNFGKIRFYNEYLSLELPVCVEYGEPDRAENAAYHERKKRVVDFYQYYLRFSMGQIGKQEWLTQTQRIIDAIHEKNRENPVRDLFQAHILITKERYGEAGRLLEQAGSAIVPEETRPETSCYYLYLTTLVSRDENYIRAVTEEIRRVYRNDQTNWEVAWLLLYLDAEFVRSLSRKWIFLEQQFDKGCRSPVWYMEGAALARRNPAFLMKLTPFVVQVLHFMARNHYLTDECISQIHYLASRQKYYSEQMYRILQVCYRKKKDSESLRAICALLIKGNKTGPEYAVWYRRGILRELWITRLYEYYMMSIDMEGGEEIPDAALRYFSYSCGLTYERTAYLYAYVIRTCGEYSELYRTYIPAMEQFLAQQLEKGHMNRDIACLYRRMMQEGLVSAETLNRYAGSLFVHEIRIKTPGIRRVMIRHGKLKSEAAYPVSGGTACVPVYDRDFSLVFEGENGGRFLCDIEYEDRALFYSQEMFPVIFLNRAGFFTEDVGVLLYQCEHGRSYTTVDRDNVQYARKIWEHEEIGEAYRNELGMKLLDYYDSQDATEELDAFLPLLQPLSMNGRERMEALRCLVLRGMYDTACDWVMRYGMEKLKPKLLMRLCSRMLSYAGAAESKVMTAMSYAAFRSGKYDESMLAYLSLYYQGTLEELYALWQACDGFDTASYELCERMLLQMLFTNEWLDDAADILKTYVAGSADEAVTAECLNYFACRYFIRGQEPSPFIWKELMRRSRNGEPCDVVCELALLEHFAGQPETGEEERGIIRAFLDDLLLKRGIVFGFFRRFSPIYPNMAYYADRTFLELRTESENPVTLHFMLQTGGEGGAYKTEEMKSCYRGLYTRSFLLFPGEKLSYYMMERRGEQETIVKSGSLECSHDMTEQMAGRTPAICRLMAAVADKNTDLAEAVLTEYYRKEFAVENLFTLL